MGGRLRRPRPPPLGAYQVLDGELADRPLEIRRVTIVVAESPQTTAVKQVARGLRLPDLDHAEALVGRPGGVDQKPDWRLLSQSSRISR